MCSVMERTRKKSTGSSESLSQGPGLGARTSVSGQGRLSRGQDRQLGPVITRERDQGGGRKGEIHGPGGGCVSQEPPKVTEWLQGGQEGGLGAGPCRAV